MDRCYFIGDYFNCPMRVYPYKLIKKLIIDKKGISLFELDIMNNYNRFIFPRVSRKIDGHFTFRRQTLFDVLPHARNLYIFPGKCILSADAYGCLAARAENIIFFPKNAFCRQTLMNVLPRGRKPLCFLQKMHFVGRRLWK